MHIGDFKIQNTANGVHKTMWKLAVYQAKANNEVIIVSPGNPPLLTDQEIAGKFSVNLSALSRLNYIPFLSELFPKFTIFNWKPDIIHFHSTFKIRHAPIAFYAKHLNIPYIITPNGGYSKYILGRNKAKHDLGLFLWERRFIKDASAVHIVGESERHDILRLGYRQKIVLIPNGFDQMEAGQWSDIRAKFGIRDTEIFCLFIGRYEMYHKGLDILLKAYKTLTENYAQNSLKIGLFGPDSRKGHKAKVLALAQQLGILDKVIFGDAVFGQEKANLIGSCDIFVHASRWEGIPFSCLEAVFFGKPLLISRATNLDKFIEECKGGLVFETENITALKEYMLKCIILGRTGLAEAGKRAQDMAALRFTWQGIADQIYSLYQSCVLSERSRPLRTSSG